MTRGMHAVVCLHNNGIWRHSGSTSMTIAFLPLGLTKQHSVLRKFLFFIYGKPLLYKQVKKDKKSRSPLNYYPSKGQYSSGILKILFSYLTLMSVLHRIVVKNILLGWNIGFQKRYVLTLHLAIIPFGPQPNMSLTTFVILVYFLSLYLMVLYPLWYVLFNKFHLRLFLCTAPNGFALISTYVSSHLFMPENLKSRYEKGPMASLPGSSKNVPMK